MCVQVQWFFVLASQTYQAVNKQLSAFDDFVVLAGQNEKEQKLFNHNISMSLMFFWIISKVRYLKSIFNFSKAVLNTLRQMIKLATDGHPQNIRCARPLLCSWLLLLAISYCFSPTDHSYLIIATFARGE